MMQRFSIAIVVTGIMMIVAPVSAEYRTGLAAYRLHHYKWAINELKIDQTRESQYLLGVMYFKGEGVAANRLEAIEWFKKAAAQGHPQALFDLGNIYYEGKDVGPDRFEAAKWYRKAAEQGHLQAQFVMGRIFMSGDGVEKNRNLAVLWLKKAAFCGHQEAGRFLKEMGEEVPHIGIPRAGKVAKKPLTEGAPSAMPVGQP